MGGKGFRHSINSSGRRTTTVGVPGTGVSYSHSHSSSKKSRNKTKPMNTTNNYTGGNGNSSSKQVYDYTQTPAYIVEKYEERVLALSQLHLNLIKPIDWNARAKQQPPFKIGEMGQNEAAASQVLKEYKPSFFAKIFKKDKAKLNNLQEQVSEASKKDKKIYAEWLEMVQQAQMFASATPDLYLELLRQTDFFKIESELGVKIRLELKEDEILIDLVINDTLIPDEVTSLSKTGRLSTKAQTKTNYYSLYQQHICSIILKVVKDCFNTLASIKEISINVIEEKVDPTDGHHKVFLLIQAAFAKEELENLNFERLEPVAAIEGFEPKWKFLKTKGYQPLAVN